MATFTNLHGEANTAAIPSLPLPADDIRQHLEMILAGDDFCSSRGSSELLRHIVERALAGDYASRKETEHFTCCCGVVDAIALYCSDPLCCMIE